MTSFRGELAFLSNFYPCRVFDKEGNSYLTVEHAYVAAKTTDFTARAKVRLLQTPGQAKRFGRTIDLRPDWTDVRMSIMRDLLKQKFSPILNPALAEKLVGTYPTELVEVNEWHDNFWGSCTHCGPGQNILGKLLMEIRGDGVLK